MPIGDIRRMFDGDVSLEDTIQLQMRRLESEREKLAAALDFCSTIKETQLADLDVDTYLNEMNKREKSGSAFARFAEDYAAVVRSEMVRDFSFMPDDRCDKPEKFTEELLKYGEQNGLHMVILKESLSPRLLINGVEYWAYALYPVQSLDGPGKLYRAGISAGVYHSLHPVCCQSLLHLLLLWQELPRMSYFRSEKHAASSTQAISSSSISESSEIST